jgi:hypothetical protein
MGIHNEHPSLGGWVGVSERKKTKLAICGAIAAPESKGPIMHK